MRKHFFLVISLIALVASLVSAAIQFKMAHDSIVAIKEYKAEQALVTEQAKQFAMNALNFSSVAYAAPSFPNPIGYVNDFAGIIPQADEQRLEQKLRDYERKTSIEIAVATIPDLQGYSIDEWREGLFKKWGVGKKKVDNGILICVAPNEKKWGIEVGYGLEGDINDGLAGSLGRENLVPYFRRGDFGGGIRALVDSIISHLGSYSWAQRQNNYTLRQEQERLERERMAEEERLAKEKAAQTFKNVITFIALFCLLALFVLILYVRNMRNKKLNQMRKEIGGTLKEAQLNLDKVQGKTYEAVEAVKNFPQWAKDDANNSLSKAKELFKTCHTEADRLGGVCNKLGLKDTTKLLSNVGSLKSSVVKLEGIVLQHVLHDLPIKLKEYQEGSYSKYSTLKTDTTWFEDFLSKSASKGFWIRDESKIIESIKSRHHKIELPKEPIPTFDYRPAYETIQNLIAELQSAKADFDAKLKAENSTRNTIQTLPKRVKNLKVKYEDQIPNLKKLESENPKEVFESLPNMFNNIPFVLSGVEGNIEEAKKLNSMETQRFVEASKIIHSVEDALNRVDAAIKAVPDKLQEIAEAKSKIPNLLESAEKAVDKAVKKSKDSDVSSGTKRKAENLMEELDTIKASLQASKVNWILMVKNLIDIEEEAVEVYKKAKHEIESAEAARRRRDDDDNWHSTTTSISIGSSSSGGSGGGGGGFGGFGGGGSGGGGASGSW